MNSGDTNGIDDIYVKVVTNGKKTRQALFNRGCSGTSVPLPLGTPEEKSVGKEIDLLKNSRISSIPDFLWKSEITRSFFTLKQ